MIRQTFAEYVADEAVNWSSLKHMDDSALHYRHRLSAERKDTAALALGRVTHSLVFEPDTLDREYAVYEGGNRIGKEWTAFAETNEGKTIFKPAEIANAVAMAAAVRAHPLVQPYLDGGLFETTIRWTDAETGLVCKARPDWMVPDRRWLVDLKTARSVHPRMFGRAVASYGYHRQLAHYAAGIEAACGWRPEKVVLIAVENTAPFDVVVYEMTDDALIVGRQDVDRLLTKLAYHRKTDTWPGRFSEEQVLDLPEWIIGDLEISTDEGA